MAVKISADQLGITIRGELAAYSEEVAEGIRKEIKEVAKETVATLKTTSPRVRIYNRAKPQLTRLLEYGHDKVNGGRVEGKPHIRPAEQQAEKKLEGAVKVVVK